MERDKVVGAEIRLSGVVQGVGFRPFVFREALRFSLTGSVRNTDRGVLINVDGARDDIDRFFEEIRVRHPALAEIHSSSIRFVEPAGFTRFSIGASVEKRDGFTPVPPDVATCPDCLRDVFEGGNRRRRYPFTNCTNCGPRFTIVRAIPYDRANTTMAAFPLCPECRAEYDDPLDRRYHAQPNACPACGPTLSLLDAGGDVLTGDPISGALSLIGRGKIVAVKGLGGYHLAVDPFDAEAVRELRARKKRPSKPFALMARDLETASRYCRLEAREAEILSSVERPILLVERSGNASRLPPGIAPDTRLLGVMLPYTPLHHILLREGPELLVMTSGNLSEEPLAFRDDEALSTLGGVADAFLVHDRAIERPCDDSVLMQAGDLSGRADAPKTTGRVPARTAGAADFVPIRRSRGFVPRGIEVGFPGLQAFAAGASEKNTFCACAGGKAYMSHHVGDLANEKSIDAYTRGVEDFLALFRVEPGGVACDLHPDYESTRFAERLSERLGAPLFRVQHHHAHVASVLAEKGVREKVIGVAFDGTGYGPDGTVWGGEFLVADAGGFERAGHFACVPMPGGEKCVLETDRMAVSWLLDAYGSLSAVPRFGFLERVGGERLSRIEAMVRAGVNSPLTSSCGRLFDAVASLAGLCDRPSYDAQGAILLESAARNAGRAERPYPYEIQEGVIRFGGTIRSIVEDLEGGTRVEEVSGRFHSTVVASGIELCGALRERLGIGTVALSGGAFQNRILLARFKDGLEEEGFTVLVHELVPPNDGGLALGQAYAALHLMGGSH